MSNELTKQDLEHFSGELRKLLHRSVDVADQIEGESLDLGGGGLDTQGDAGADAEFEEVDLDSLSVEEAATEATAAALKRISDGTFGRCTQCDEWIPRGRLEVVPYAPHCVSCQEAAEEGDE